MKPIHTSGLGVVKDEGGARSDICELEAKRLLSLTTVKLA